MGAADSSEATAPGEEVEDKGDKGKASGSVVWSSGAWKLYFSRGLTAFGDRLWSFGVGLLLFHLYPGNLTVVAAYGLVNSLVSILGGPQVGAWIDSTRRLRAARLLLLVQNLAVAVDCAVFAAFYWWEVEAEQVWGGSRAVVAVLTASIAILANLASAGSRVVVEKDWVVVISGGSEDNLAQLNTIFRTIDLVCLNVSPILAGLGFSQSYVVTALAIGIWNLLSVLIEFWLLTSIYTQFGSLASKALPEQQEEEETFGLVGSLRARVTGTMVGWSYYWSHPVRGAGLGLACLYMTVLGFDTITWGYALLQCVSELALGCLLAASALLGIAGSLAFPALRRAAGGAGRAGLFGMAALVSALSLCVVSVWLPGSPFDPWYDAAPDQREEGSGAGAWEEGNCQDNKPVLTSVSVLLTGIILARFGLWISDLAVTQIIQENVEEGRRGVVGGVQNSMNSGFDLLKFCLVLLLPQQEMFGLLVLLSFTFICLGAASLTVYVVRQDNRARNSQYSKANTEEKLQP